MFYFLIGTLFIAVGLGVHMFKMYFLISGYNTMSKEKKANVDTEKLGRLMGIYFYLNGGTLILTGVLEALGIKIGFSPVMVFFGISTVFLLIKSQKYDHNIYDEDGKLKEGAWKQLALDLGIIGIVSAVVIVSIFFMVRETEITILDEGLEIHGIYGETYSWDSVEKIELIDKLPNIELRTNGSAVGSELKGNFRTTELGEVKLFVDSDTPPYLYMEAGGKTIIFNTGDSKRTEALFKEIETKLVD